MIDRNHPAVTRWFPNGNVAPHIRLAVSFAEVIREALPHLTADDLRHTPAGRELMGEAWDEGLWAGKTYHPSKRDFEDMYLDVEPVPPTNPYKETP